MTRYEKIKTLCKERGITITGLERELGFARGSLSKIDKNQPSADRLEKLSSYFGLPVDYFLEVQTLGQQKYYTDDRTADIAQKIFDNKKLRLLFDEAVDASPEDLQTAHDILLALKRKERGTID